jgi:chemotaxis protein MotB
LLIVDVVGPAPRRGWELWEMRSLARVAILLAPALLAVGCNGNPFLAPQGGQAWNGQPPTIAQADEWQRRAAQLDADNADLQRRVAQSQQQVQLLNEQFTQVQKRLNETANQLRDAQVAKQEANQQLEAILASTRQRGGASITANNSVTSTLKVADIQGLEVRQDGDVVRIELPSDRLFLSGGVQLQPDAHVLLDQVATAIARNYPRQLVGVEGHTDTGPATNGYSSNHQLSAAQAIVVLEQLVTRNRLPSKQLFALAMGANHPRVSNATPAGRARNRRVELVIYPEAVEGS